MAKEQVSTILPKGQKYLSNKCRLLTGYESLMLQGLFWSHEQDTLLQSMDNDLLLSLAGNAFEASCCSAVLLACILVQAASANDCAVTVTDTAASDSEAELLLSESESASDSDSCRWQFP